MAYTPGDSAPLTSTWTVSGTLSQRLPVAQTPAISVAPMPVANAPTAPDVVVCESVPRTSWPGLDRRSSTISWWQMPSPASKNLPRP